MNASGGVLDGRHEMGAAMGCRGMADSRHVSLIAPGYDEFRRRLAELGARALRRHGACRRTVLEGVAENRRAHRRGIDPSAQAFIEALQFGARGINHHHDVVIGVA